MKSKTWKNYLFEGALIVFSVMLALFLNQIVENINTSRDKEKAISHITAELQRNLEIVEEWAVIHNRMKSRTDSIINGQNAELRNQLLDESILNLGVLTGGESIVNSSLSNTAWETAKATRIINEFEFETVELLTGVYSLQELVFNNTIMKLTDTFFERETHDPELLEGTLLQLQLRFTELVGQETVLIEAYRDAIRQLSSQ